MKVSVLVAEDMPETSSEHRKVLESFGFDVLVGSRPDQVAQALQDRSIDCVWLDLNFGPAKAKLDFTDDEAVDGLSLLAQSLRSDEEPIPALVYSGFIDDDARAKAARLRVTEAIYHWYDKPFDTEIIAFETLQAASIYLWRREARSLKMKLGEASPAEMERLRTMMQTADPWSDLLRRDRGRLAKKLTHLLVGFERAVLGEHEDEASHYLRDVRFLASRQLHFYVDTEHRNFQLLADGLVYIFEAAEDRLFEPRATGALRRAVECIGRDWLSDDHLCAVRDDLENSLELPLGPVLGGDEAELQSYLGDLSRSEEWGK